MFIDHLYIFFMSCCPFKILWLIITIDLQQFFIKNINLCTHIKLHIWYFLLIFLSFLKTRWSLCSSILCLYALTLCLERLSPFSGLYSSLVMEVLPHFTGKENGIHRVRQLMSRFCIWLQNSMFFLLNQAASFIQQYSELLESALLSC